MFSDVGFRSLTPGCRELWRRLKPRAAELSGDGRKEKVADDAGRLGCEMRLASSFVAFTLSNSGTDLCSRKQLQTVCEYQKQREVLQDLIRTAESNGGLVL